MTKDDSYEQRDEMIQYQIANRGVKDKQVLDAMRSVPREEFVSEQLREVAYEDTPLPIAAQQTISQPYMVAAMIEALELNGGEKVLEIGTGSGYSSAVLAEIAGDVFTIERIHELAEQAQSVLSKLHYDNVHVSIGDGTLGWAEHAPYEAIVVTAGGPNVPETLKSQLDIGGRLVIPVGSTQRHQKLVRVRRVSKDEFQTEQLADVCFVPLVGKEGWEPTNSSEDRHDSSSEHVFDQ